MRGPVAYVTSLYPSPTHTFIRREIAALERSGVSVLRYAIRPPDDPPVDADDREELARVRVVLDQGPLALVRATVRMAITAPRRFAAGLALAVRLGRGAPRGVLMHLAYLAEACVLREWAAADGARHLHAHFTSNTAAVAALCHAVGGPAYSITIHGPTDFDHPVELKLREKVAGAQFAAVISDYARSQVFRWTRPEDWPRVHVVRCGVDERWLERPHDPVPDAARFVTVGRLVPQKGQLLLVEAANALLDEGRNLELVIIGDGEMRPALEAAIRRGGHGDAIRLAGWQPNGSVAAEMARARAVVLPSFAEGLPVVLMEALAMARPVITTAIAGIPELVEPGVNGWLIPAGSVPALVDAMREALDTPTDVLEAMGKAGADLVATRHDIDREAAVLARLFGQAMDEGIRA